jgi:hypothetical protein
VVVVVVVTVVVTVAAAYIELVAQQVPVASEWI